MTDELNKDLLSELIDRDLADLNEDIRIPGNVQAAWRARLQEEEMIGHKVTGPWQKWLGAAAAAVFILGGTFLSEYVNKPTAPGAGVMPAPAVTEFGGANESLYEMYDMAVEPETARSMPNVALKSQSSEAPASDAKRIRTVRMTLTTLNFDQTIQSIEAQVQSINGYVAYQDINSSREKLRSANYELRIPQESLDTFIEEAKKIGSLKQITQSVTDETDYYKDLAMRLETQESKMERLKALLTETATLTEILEWENAIADTQYTLDSLIASMQSIDNRVAYSEVSLTLNEQTGVEALPNQDLPLTTRILEGLRASLRGLESFLKSMVVFIVSAAPFIGIVAVVFIAVTAVKKISQKKRRIKGD